MDLSAGEGQTDPSPLVSVGNRTGREVFSMKELKRKCFSVLLIIMVIMQDPSLARAEYLEESRISISQPDAVCSILDERVEKEDLTSLNEYQIQYYLNGGENDAENPLLYSTDDLPFTLHSPQRTGYNFAGWYTDSSFQNKIHTIDAADAGNLTVYAKWTRPIDDYYNVQMYSYQNSRSRCLEKKLKDCSYEFLDNVEIPGMPSTRESDVDNNRIPQTGQCPQGICLTPDYLLVSAYTSTGKGNPGNIHVFSRKTGKYLVTMGMRGKSHLGGLTFDGKNVWVCHSNNNTLECIPYVFVKRLAADSPECVIDCSTLFESYHVSNSPSCITWYDGKLWVATHTRMLNSRVVSYRVTPNGLRQVDSYRIPDKVQGIAFDPASGSVILSTSYGRTKSSWIKVYASVEELDTHPASPRLKVEMPPCSEEIALADNGLYVLFESAGEKYFEGTDGRGSSISPIDRILVLSENSIFP